MWLKGEVKTPPFSQAARLRDICRGSCRRGSLSGFHTHGLCRSLEHGAMSCGSTMRAARFASSIELILMQWSSLMW